MKLTLSGVVDAALPLVLVIAMTAACCHQAVRDVGPPPAERPYCAAFSAATPEGIVNAEACVGTRIECERAVDRARRWGSLGGLRGIGDCYRRDR